MNRLTRLLEYTSSRCIMLYWSCHNEVRTHELALKALKDGRRVVLPRCDVEEAQIYPYEVKDVPQDLVVGPFGICEPSRESREITDLSGIDLCIVPGIAFDGEGNRVGRGLGYYDRFLSKLCETTEKIGVGYAFQIVDKICPTDGDAHVDKIVTEEETLVAHRR
jgi:5-formyltetrahydrofolate cyclo-ligase